MAMLSHHVYGKREDVLIAHGGESFTLTFTRSSVARGEPVAVAWRGRDSFTVTSPRANHRVVTHGDAVMGFRVLYEDRHPREKFTILFSADRDWTIRWNRDHKARVPAPPRVQSEP